MFAAWAHVRALCCSISWHLFAAASLAVARYLDVLRGSVRVANLPIAVEQYRASLLCLCMCYNSVLQSLCVFFQRSRSVALGPAWSAPFNPQLLV